ncbi:MAG: hypothetical protein IJG62_04360, partial [Synergistaceae bacterium]|nr:hypothetical protein [Synergistaceae bacterium]
GKKIGFSRAHRASIDRVQGITFTVPNREVQDSKISQIEQLEAKIAHAEANLKILAGKCASILNNYLN